MEERLKAMANEDGEDYGEELNKLREEMKQTKDIVKNIEMMLAQIHAESVRSSNQNDDWQMTSSNEIRASRLS